MTREQFLCDKMGYEVPYSFPPFFSTWEGFGDLFTWAKEQEWWKHFADVTWKSNDGMIIGDLLYNLIDPDRFADTVSKYLGWED
jgi:hypothetical protein